MCILRDESSVNAVFLISFFFFWCIISSVVVMVFLWYVCMIARLRCVKYANLVEGMDCCLHK